MQQASSNGSLKSSLSLCVIYGTKARRPACPQPRSRRVANRYLEWDSNNDPWPKPNNVVSFRGHNVVPFRRSHEL